MWILESVFFLVLDRRQSWTMILWRSIEGKISHSRKEGRERKINDERYILYIYVWQFSCKKRNTFSVSGSSGDDWEAKEIKWDDSAKFCGKRAIYSSRRFVITDKVLRFAVIGKPQHAEATPYEDDAWVSRYLRVLTPRFTACTFL